MARRDKGDASEDKGKLHVHPLVEGLSERPEGIPPDSVVVSGLAGRGEGSEWRLYQDLSLASYISFDEADILHSVELSNAERPLAGSLVWLKPNATVQVVKVHSESVPASFLGGSIVDQFGSPSGPAPRPPFGRFHGNVVGEWSDNWGCGRTWNWKARPTCGANKTCQQWKTCNPGEDPDDPCSKGFGCTWWYVCGDRSDGEACPK